ncbi:metallophosphoesterase [Pseudomonas sp. RAC1]|uniref:metallophosphoesterase n=1 Tax=Pseudomonas sp. RAC1 TaxID=3064900 RepID=UPI002717C389|nr:metallophosphoesterase [Pseudomonas sp. RAC1]MDV9031738.1 metallophosphoesterase [Pseudomonas sp. RAC1]
MLRFQSMTANTAGRDLAVGDIHGHFQRLQAALELIAFDPSVDRLFSVGDLVDRGPASADVLHWLAQPWFHAVQGNHEALAITHVRGGQLDLDMYRAAGGSWFLDLAPSEQLHLVEHFEALPIAMQIPTPLGLIGLLHADSPFPDWQQLRAGLEAGDPNVQEVCQWSRRRLKTHDVRPVEGLRALLVGHTPVPEHRVLGNVWHLDTGGWSNGFFSLLDIATLKIATPTFR